MYTNTIPVFARFQWLNHPRVENILSKFLKSPERGRKGYDKVLMFKWLIYKHLMRCSYRDLESMTDIDYSTFIKFRQRLLLTHWFSKVFHLFSSIIARNIGSITAIVDSSFVETYSKHDENGSEYSGYKKKNGFKLHQIIDFKTRLPLLQATTGGARSDIVWGAYLIRAAPEEWKINGFLADKAYDSEEFVRSLRQKWKGVRVGIPVRHTIHERIRPWPPPVIRNRQAKESNRCLRRPFLNKRTEIERYFSRKKRVFNLGEERTRQLKNFRANCNMVAIMEILEWSTKPQILLYYSPNSLDLG